MHSVAKTLSKAEELPIRRKVGTKSHGPIWNPDLISWGVLRRNYAEVDHPQGLFFPWLGPLDANVSWLVVGFGPCFRAVTGLEQKGPNVGPMGPNGAQCRPKPRGVLVTEVTTTYQHHWWVHRMPAESYWWCSAWCTCSSVGTAAVSCTSGGWITWGARGAIVPLHPRSQGFVFAGTLAQGTLLCTAGRIESSHSMSALWKRRQSGNPQLDAFPRHQLLSFSPLFGFLVTPLLPFSPTTLQRHIVGFGTLPHTMAHKKHMHI